MEKMEAPPRKNSKSKYYSGWIKIKTPECRNYLQFYVELQARELVLFVNEDKSRRNHVEDRISLRNIKKVKKSPQKSKFKIGENEHNTITLTYNCEAKTKIQIKNTEEQEDWFKYLYVVAMIKMPETTQNLLPGQIIHLRNVLEEIAKLESVIADPNPPPYSKEDPIYRMENTTTEKNSFHNPYLKPDLPRFEQEAEDESKEEPYLPMKGTALPCYGKMNTLPHGQGLYAMAIDDDDDAPPVPPRSEDEYTVMYPQEKHASHSSCNLHIHQTQLSPSINKRNLTEENLYKRNPTHVFNIGHKTLSYVKFPPKVPSRRRIHSSSELMSVQGFRNDHSLMLDSREEFEKKEESPNVTKFPHRVLARSKSQDLLDLSSHDFPLGQLLEKDLPTPNIAKWLIDRPTNRTEAEAILQNNQEFGNLIVRRREMHGKEKYAVSVGPLHSQKLFKHFVIREESNECATEYFIILGDKTPPKLPSLESVVEYFVKESFGRYKPLQNMATENEHIYDTKISE